MGTIRSSQFRAAIGMHAIRRYQRKGQVLPGPIVGEHLGFRLNDQLPMILGNPARDQSERRHVQDGGGKGLVAEDAVWCTLSERLGRRRNFRAIEQADRQHDRNAERISR